MEDILITIINALIPTIITVLGGALTWLAVKVKSTIEEKSKNEIVKNIINDTVKYIEQVSKELNSEEKFNMAKNTALTWLNGKGIKLTDAEITILIESAVNGLK